MQIISSPAFKTRCKSHPLHGSYKKSSSSRESRWQGYKMRAPIYLESGLSDMNVVVIIHVV